MKITGSVEKVSFNNYYPVINIIIIYCVYMSVYYLASRQVNMFRDREKILRSYYALQENETLAMKLNKDHNNNNTMATTVVNQSQQQQKQSLPQQQQQIWDKSENEQYLFLGILTISLVVISSYVSLGG
jgi:hypothetical protein